MTARVRGEIGTLSDSKRSPGSQQNLVTARFNDNFDIEGNDKKPKQRPQSSDCNSGSRNASASAFKRRNTINTTSLPFDQKRLDTFTTISPEQINRTDAFSTLSQKGACSIGNAKRWTLNGTEPRSPGPACYRTEVHSCRQCDYKKITMPKAKRFFEAKNTSMPTAPLYDTRPKVTLLLKRHPTVRIAQASRRLEPTLFLSKNNRAIERGCTIIGI